MKNVNTLLNIVAIVGVAILFFLFFKSNSCTKKAGADVNAGAAAFAKNGAGAIAYFEMDSVEAQYNYIKDVSEQLKTREQAVSNDLNNSRKTYMNRIQQLNQQSPNMNQQQGQAAQEEINKMQLDIQQKEAKLTQELQEHKFKLMQDIQQKIENFLKNYNKGKKYIYIFSHQTGDFLYYKDSVNNITADLIQGLNELYKSSGKK